MKTILCLLTKPLLGKVLARGVCPPSNPSGAPPPDREFCPPWPLPAVLPLPEPLPRPTRTLSCFACGLSLRLFSAMTPSGGIGVPGSTCVPYPPSLRRPLPRYPREWRSSDDIIRATPSMDVLAVPTGFGSSPRVDANAERLSAAPQSSSADRRSIVARYSLWTGRGQDFLGWNRTLKIRGRAGRAAAPFSFRAARVRPSG